MKGLICASVALAAVASPAHGATLVRLDGIGPVKLGMSRMAALDTNWLGARSTGCTLGGKPYPVDYSLTGAKAPSGIKGTAEFQHGKLMNMAFSGGVRTATGVVPGTTSWPTMVTKYRDAGYRVSARYDSTFVGTFVTVKRKKGKASVMVGFAEKGKAIGTIGIPYIPLCE